MAVIVCSGELETVSLSECDVAVVPFVPLTQPVNVVEVFPV